MEAAAVAARALHFAAVVALFGELVFVAVVARRAGEADERRSPRVAGWSIALAFATGAAWLALEASSMSGAPLPAALAPDTLGAVLVQTHFGRIWSVRLALMPVAGGLLFLSRGKSRARESALLLIAAFLLASLAWAGHAAAERGADRLVHLSADAVHLLAAGAWLGALPGLASLLANASRTRGIAVAALAIRRFSVLGIASVGALVLTGGVNAWYTLGSLPALLGTSYGRLLLLKLALFAAMLSLATVNRLRLTPRVVHRADGSALRQLRRNAIAETALGVAVLGVVGVLGISIPAAHVQTVWPFSYTIDEDWAVVRAHPTTYFRSPVPYDAPSIAAGSRLYARNCVGCHGTHGHGDGPAADSLPQRPADLTAHLLHHREGDLFWWLRHGIAGTAMPRFSTLGERDLWDLIQFLRAQALAQEAKTMTASVEPWRAVPAPDFAFQEAPGREERLADERARRAVLLVLYTLPGSAARLQSLSESKGELERAGVRVIALPMNESEGGIAAVYAMFAPPSPHQEFLIDRQGYLRARWTPGVEPGFDRGDWLIHQLALLNGEKHHPRPRREHTH